MVNALREKFADLNFTYSVGGQISFDVRAPRFCLPAQRLIFLDS